MKIVYAADAPAAYRIAADACAELWEKVTGQSLELTTELDENEDAIIVGADDVCDSVRVLINEEVLDSLGIRYGTDDYCIRTLRRGTQTILLLAGGRGRSTLYAVYDFFHRAANCNYYWDGDTIPHRDTIEIKGYNVVEKPRFQYRGLRYFAHRSLHRFQAEHWGYDDWCREIDWMVKRRLNYFMLRIGHDDVFQKAFPDIVSYPDPEGILPEATEGYDNRTLFWSLQFRGQLRKKILQYAFDRDLIHSEDCGTMTHWYSRTPNEFLEKIKPDFVPQTTAGYRQPTGLVWDIRQKENLERYFKITDAYVENYGKPELFHTIGLAERMCYEERRDNLNFKLYTYRQICRHLREKYPLAKLMIASWDFVMYWKPEEVQKLVAELDPEQCIILDYTSESTSTRNFFGNWGVQNKFPWVFGIFHGYENNSDMRGDYPHIEKRLAMAKDDPMCKGMIFWPELSHSDTLMLEYLTENAWNPLDKPLFAERENRTLLVDMCRGRYGDDWMYMEQVWKRFMPIMPLSHWSYDRENACYMMDNRDVFFGIHSAPRALTVNPTGKIEPGSNVERYEQTIRYATDLEYPLREHYAPVYERLAGVTEQMRENPMLLRDAVDLARSTMSRHLNTQEMLLEMQIRDFLRGSADADGIRERCARIMRELALFAEILALTPEYSLGDSLEKLKAEAPVNQHFERTLKDNAVNGYCRSHIYELAQYVYIPEHQIYFDWLDKFLDGNAPEIDFGAIVREMREQFLDTPLSDMAPSAPADWRDLMLRAKAAVEER